MDDQTWSLIEKHYQAIKCQKKGFTERAEQKEMMAAMVEVFAPDPVVGGERRQGDTIVLIEGPTGVGKSIAYLLAGTVMAQLKGKRLIVASATIALQEQLIYKDLPLFSQTSGLNFTYAIAKGRNHYLCPYRLNSVYRDSKDGEFTLTEEEQGNEEKKWIQKTIEALYQSFSEGFFSGDRAQWPEAIPDSLWNSVNNRKEQCFAKECPYRRICPYLLVRENYGRKDVLIVNHDLLLSDLDLGGGVVLPPPEECFYCIDEAHRFARTSLKHFARSYPLSLSEHFIENSRQLLLFFSSYVKGEENIVSSLHSLLAEYGADSHIWGERLQKNIRYFVQDAYNLASPATWLLDKEAVALLGKEAFDHSLFLSLSLEEAFKKLRSSLERLTLPEEEKSRLWLLYSRSIEWIKLIKETWQLLTKTAQEGQSPTAKWITLGLSSTDDFVFHVSPTQSSSTLVDDLWLKASGVVLTSATLTVDNSFDNILQRTGLAVLPGVKTLKLNSPFNYSLQAELFIPEMQFDPSNYRAHSAEVSALLPKLISMNQPVGSLVLFASRKQLELVLQSLPEEYQNIVLTQGDLPTAQLLEEHSARILVDGKASILFGLVSFAEGLDLRGELCTQVIITKIPFIPPNDPVTKIYCDWLESNGLSSFKYFSLPEASIRLAQAGGRLIRHEKDKGRLILLDNRLQKKTYGKILLANFSDYKRV